MTYQNEQGSHATPVKNDAFLVLTEEKAMAIPNVLLPSQLHNDGNFIISLSQLCRWLGQKAEDLGVEVYPGFGTSSLLLSRLHSNSSSSSF